MISVSPLPDRIWEHYREGQCDDWQPSREYLEAAREAVIVVAEKEGIKPDTELYDCFLATLDVQESRMIDHEDLKEEFNGTEA